jgi:surface protein
MRAMFSRCTVFNEDISRWNISSCEDLSIMFCDCKKFNQDISQWDVSNVTNVEDIFRDAYNFDQDLTPWTTRGHISRRNVHIKKYIK